MSRKLNSLSKRLEKLEQELGFKTKKIICEIWLPRDHLKEYMQNPDEYMRKAIQNKNKVILVPGQKQIDEYKETH